MIMLNNFQVRHDGGLNSANPLHAIGGQGIIRHAKEREEL
jgi:hypothetical protein